MNFTTKNLMAELSELINLKRLLEERVIAPTDNSEKILEYVKDRIGQNMRDIVHTERL